MTLFINIGILGEVGAFSERSFYPISPNNVVTPNYDGRYFETLPTVWAGAYRFQQSIEANDQDAVAEWAAIFLLYYFGTVHVEEISKTALEQTYPPNLDIALEHTYPLQPKPTSLTLLMAGQETTVGGCYPSVVFFPARNRREWRENDLLQPLLDGNKLSWRRCSQVFLTDKNQREKFHLLLRRVEFHILTGNIQNAMHEFCDREFGRTLPAGYEVPLPRNPKEWPHAGESVALDDLLQYYPLRKARREGGFTYFLVSQFPFPSPWMKTAIGSGLPAPAQYQYNGQSSIKVEHRGKSYTCPLKDTDEVIELSELFLPDQACRVDLSKAEAESNLVRKLHRLEGLTNDGNQVSSCMFPITRKFLKYFPEFLTEDDQSITGATVLPAGNGIEWKLTILGKEIKWSVNYFASDGLKTNQLILWPPMVDPRWHFYVASGTGGRADSGRWHLVDENGDLGKLHDQAPDEYVSLLANEQADRPNRPRAIFWTDANNQDRGVFFLNKLPARSGGSPSEAQLAVDFGTSNTGLAFKVPGKSPITLTFSLKPAAIWGRYPKLNRAGFIPFTGWGGQKGFFASFLLTNNSAGIEDLDPSQIRPDHLFSVCIPNLYDNSLTFLHDLKGWTLYTNLKWNSEPKSPPACRPLFLQLVLLYACAEVFFHHHLMFTGYIFTFPLAFSRSEREIFHGQNQESLHQIQRWCYGTTSSFAYVGDVDESTAAAAAANIAPSGNKLDLFIDVGGGTADIAVRYKDRIVLLDSIKLAGKQFFEFTKQNLNPEQELKGSETTRRHLGTLLAAGNDLRTGDVDIIGMSAKFKEGLNSLYLLRLNDLNPRTVVQREKVILEKKMGQASYQRYRTALFFRHLLAYGLLQACAVAVEQKLSPQELTSGIQLILGGNAWGLMMFAEFERSKDQLKDEAETLLDMIKQRIEGETSEKDWAYIRELQVFDVELLNEGDLSRAKTCVPIGAMYAAGHKNQATNTAPFSGISFPHVQINEPEHFDPVEIRWCDRWNEVNLRRKIGAPHMIQISKIEINIPQAATPQPIHPLLTLFTCVGNERSSKDPMPATDWQKINDFLRNLSQTNRTPLGCFLSGVLYADQNLSQPVVSSETSPHPFLETLARVNGTFR